MQIRRINNRAGCDHYMLADDDGNALPHQVKSCLISEPHEVPKFTVTFIAGRNGLQVVDEKEEPQPRYRMNEDGEFIEL